MTAEPLRISLDDLLAADSRGKWWLVGAGWAGNPIVERQEQRSKEKTKKVKPVMEQEEQLLEVARKQGMNTDIRRSIFVVLMTSEVRSCMVALTAGLLPRVRPHVPVQAVRDAAARVRTRNLALRWLGTDV